jgi:GNAT superfamily N-acetyltransferase
MSRGNIRVRLAVCDDIPALAALAAQVEVIAPGLRAVRRPGTDRLTAHIGAVLEDSSRVMLVAQDEFSGDVLGTAVLVEEEVSSIVPLHGLTVSNLLVGQGHRRRGVGRALLIAAVRHAEAIGVDTIVVGVRSEDRDTHRYLARLGFTSLVVRRTANVATVRRSLGLSDISDRRQRALGRVLTAGRMVRRGA